MSIYLPQPLPATLDPHPKQVIVFLMKLKRTPGMEHGAWRFISLPEAQLPGGGFASPLRRPRSSRGHCGSETGAEMGRRPGDGTRAAGQTSVWGEEEAGAHSPGLGGGSERRGCACAPRTLLPGPCDPPHLSSVGRCGPASLPGGGGGRAGRWAAAVLSAVVGVVVGGADTAPSPLSTRSPEPARVSSSR